MIDLEADKKQGSALRVLLGHSLRFNLQLAHIILGNRKFY